MPLLVERGVLPFRLDRQWESEDAECEKYVIHPTSFDLQDSLWPFFFLPQPVVPE